MTTLVFLENHDGELTKGALGVLGKAASLGGDVAGVVLGSGVRDAAAAAGGFGASTVYVVDDEALAAPLPQPRVDALEAVVRESGADTVLFAASVLAADVAAGLAARLEAGLNRDLTDLRREGDELVGVRPALGDTVLVEVGWTSTPRLALVRAGTFDPVESGRSAEVKDVSATFQDFSTQARLVEHLTEKATGPSIEDADVIVAGGRGLGGPEGFAVVEELAKALGGAVAATRAAADDQDADLDPLVGGVRRRADRLRTRERRRVVGRADAAHRRARSSSVSFGAICVRSPTTPRSAKSKIGAFGSLLTATIVPEPCMPTLCWMAPEMPSAT